MQSETVNLVTTWVGWLDLALFIIAYYFIATKESHEIDKAKPALFAGVLMFFLIGIYYSISNINPEPLDKELEALILYISKIFFFLLVSMTYIETLIERRVFDVLRYKLVSKAYTYKQLFWFTGFLTFFISSVTNNFTAALILSTVLITIDIKNTPFLVVSAVNIVVAANAGAAWSPFGDITTLMVWTSAKSEFINFLYLFPATISGWLVTAFFLSVSLPKGKPDFDASLRKKPVLLDGAMGVIFLGIITIIIALLAHHFFHFPAMWGMLFGLALLKLFSTHLQKSGQKHFCVYVNMQKIKKGTLLFLFGILSAIGALHFLGFLHYIENLYDMFGVTATNIGVGFVSAIIDNISVMNTVISASPDMGLEQWLLVTMTTGVGGSLISFGSAAGIGVMGRLKGIYTFSSHIKHAWTILAGYIISITIWYFQFEILGLY